MKVTVCIGSACHLKGAGRVLEQLRYLVREHGLEKVVVIAATFCMGNCVAGVNVTIDGEVFSVEQQDTRAFFEREILAKVS